MKYIFFILVLTIFIFLIISSSSSKCDIILINGNILTMKSPSSVFESCGIKGNIITRLGNNREVLKYKGKKTEVFDLKGKTVIPGLHDAHLHFQAGSKLLFKRLDLRFMNKEEILRKISEVVKSSSPKALIKAYSYNHTFFKDKKWPDRYDLDKVAPDNPVIITRVDGHSVWVNSKTLEMAGITEKTKDPQGGEILRFRNGEPTGILKDNAEELVKNVTGAEMTIPGKGGKDTLREGIKYANSLGLTSVTTSGGTELIEKLKKIEKDTGLTLRFNVWITPEEMKESVRKGVKFNSGSQKIKISFVKVFADGSLGSVSAAFFKPYLSRPSTRGILIHPVKELQRIIEEVHKNNWQVGVHAIGNRAVHLVLDAVLLAQKKFGQKGLRHRIEHTQFITDADILRFRKLKMIPSMQPTHCTTDLLVVNERIGSDRGRQGYRWKSFKKEDILLAFGTDWPVEPLDPRRGIYSSVERKNIEKNIPKDGWFQNEAVSIEDALKYYTFGSAYASFNEKVLGTIEKGKLADITVFGDDLISLSKRNRRDILKIPVFMTIVDGKIVYKNPEID